MTETASQPWISNDAVVLGLLLASLPGNALLQLGIPPRHLHDRDQQCGD